MGWWSIPAHAGEPWRPAPTPSSVPVYPRPRGGAAACSAARSAFNGLSPPTRGSLEPGGVDLGPGGSIPAHAGEPDYGPALQYRHEVYPRPRGGAASIVVWLSSGVGLSPPTRGSHEVIERHDPSQGSIPAHAGEPAGLRVSPVSCSVYPRPRGGALDGLVNFRRIAGLSPPTRGSRSCMGLSCGSQGSIPAHAGEPLYEDPAIRLFRVYPRPRGGAVAGLTA